MRLFLALDIDNSVRRRILGFMDGVRNFAPDARWAKEESLHLTLKFIGEFPDSKLDEIKKAMSTIAAASTKIDFHGYGFFPTPKSARVFWIGVECGPQLSALAAAIDDKLSTIGIPKEDRKFSPHLTLARASGASGSPRRHKNEAASRTFQRLQEKLSPLSVPEFGSMTPREFFLYQSQLSPKGSKYTKLASFPLSTAVVT
jgi:2'-5' RNA ligase